MPGMDRRCLLYGQQGGGELWGSCLGMNRGSAETWLCREPLTCRDPEPVFTISLSLNESKYQCPFVGLREAE